VLYRLHFRGAIPSVPTRVIDRLRARLREISETLSTISSISSFWTSLAENPLTIDVAGWRFTYTIVREPNYFQVLEAVRVSHVVWGRRDAARAKRGA
jgi:hypothetical protein